MSSEMIERVSKAICCPDGCQHTMSCSIPNSRDMRKAKAAIEAMKDYLDNMNAQAEASDTGHTYTLDSLIKAVLK